MTGNNYRQADTKFDEQAWVHFNDIDNSFIQRIDELKECLSGMSFVYCMFNQKTHKLIPDTFTSQSL